jgi:hypothetical protein
MFEQAINELEAMGIPYAENEDGTLVIDISDADKTDVVTIVAFLNDNGMEYSIDAESISLMAPIEPVEEPMEEEAPPMDPMAGAMDDFF